MYFLYNFFIWFRKIIIRILIKEYPNKLIKSKNIPEKNSDKYINFISSTDNFWISNSMFKKWGFYNEIAKKIMLIGIAEAKKNVPRRKDILPINRK